MKRGGWWRHKCVICGAVFFGSKCRISCPTCHEEKLDRACGRCLVCDRRIPFFPKAKFPKRRGNRGPLYCSDCFHERKLESNKRNKQLHRIGYAGVMTEKPLHDDLIVVTPAVGEEL